MYRRILVPLDRSRTAEAVLPHLPRLATAGLEEVVLVTVVDPAAPEGEEAAHARSYLRIVAARLGHEGIPAVPVVKIGALVPSLLELADRSRADTLLAMATHGESARAGSTTGSVTRLVFRASPVPVFAVRSVTPAPRREGPIRSLLVPTDGSARSLAAFPHALSFAKAHGARVRLIHVLPRGAAARRRQRTGSLRAESLARGWMKHLVDPFIEQGIPVRLSVKRGDPTASILSSIRTQPADLVAISTHGETAPSFTAMGSVTEAILAGSRVPLLIVSAPTPPARLVGPTLSDFRTAALDAEEPGRPPRRPVARRPSWT